MPRRTKVLRVVCLRLCCDSRLSLLLELGLLLVVAAVGFLAVLGRVPIVYSEGSPATHWYAVSGRQGNCSVY